MATGIVIIVRLDNTPPGDEVRWHGYRTALELPYSNSVWSIPYDTAY